MGNFFIVMSNILIACAFVLVAWRLSDVQFDLTRIVNAEFRADQCSQHNSKVLEFIDKEYEVISAKLSDVGFVCEGALLESSMGKTEFISEIDKRLGDGEDDVTRANIRRAVTMAADMMAEMTTAECIAFVRRLRNG